MVLLKSNFCWNFVQSRHSCQIVFITEHLSNVNHANIALERKKLGFIDDTISWLDNRQLTFLLRWEADRQINLLYRIYFLYLVVPSLVAV